MPRCASSSLYAENAPECVPRSPFTFTGGQIAQGGADCCALPRKAAPREAAPYARRHHARTTYGLARSAGQTRADARTHTYTHNRVHALYIVCIFHDVRVRASEGAGARTTSLRVLSQDVNRALPLKYSTFWSCRARCGEAAWGPVLCRSFLLKPEMVKPPFVSCVHHVHARACAC